MDERQRAIQAVSFGTAAEAYERGRPGYPAQAISWLLQGAGRRVLDLGAGTGKLTRQLQERGHDVTAVEPSKEMRERLMTAVPEARALDGTAESIPLPDVSVDAVLVAQAWHWVDTRRAVPEVARVLVPRGVAGLVWNQLDERDVWNARLERLIHPDDGQPVDASVAAFADWPGLFGPAKHFTVEWRYTLTEDRLIDLVSSTSYVVTLPEAERADLLAEVRDLAEGHPALELQDRIELPYITKCHRIRRA